MNRKAILLIGLLISCCTYAQVAELSQEWIKSIEDKHSFQTLATENFQSLDFSPLLSNQRRLDKDPLSTYVGAFGPKYRRIDVHLEVSKVGSHYQLVGKSKLNQNIRPLQGKMTLKKVLWRQWDYLSDRLYIGFFDCTLKEPGNKEGDGCYSGIFTLVFFQGEDGPEIFKTSSGDWPNFTNTFIGKWKRYHSQVERRVIFSYHAAGLYEGLPYCQALYTYGENPDLTIIKEAYRPFGWEGYPQRRGEKDKWWE